MTDLPTLDDIRAAAARIAPHAHRTPVLRSSAIDAMMGMRLFFKCENFQKVGAFKFRGACNTVMGLSDDEARAGVATHSSGNHAQALALAARMRGIPAHVVMPENSPRIKQAAVRDYGAEIISCKPTQAARESTLTEVVARTGATFVHPYNDLRVITGQATCAMELLEDVTDLDAVLAPVGGGGLMSGTALAVHYLAPHVRAIGAEPAGADDAHRSLQAGRILPSEDPRTVADGLRTSLGSHTFRILSTYLERIALTREESIIRAMRLVWERMKIIIEPSCAVPLSTLMDNDLGLSGKRVGIILTGGNVDLDRLPWQLS